MVLFCIVDGIVQYRVRYYCNIVCGIVQYHPFDRPAVDGFLTTSNNTLVRDCLDHPTVIKTTTVAKMMILILKTLITAITS